jgi:hypothetical protein
MDEPKVKPPTPEAPSTTDSAAQPETRAAPAPGPQSTAPSPAKVDVAEREPLSVVVVDTPAAEPAVLPETRVEVPVEIPAPPIEVPPEAPRVPYPYWLLAAVVLALLLFSYKNIYEPFLIHVEDSVERRVLGEPSKIWQAPQSDPHTRQQKQRWTNFKFY